MKRCLLVLVALLVVQSSAFGQKQDMTKRAAKEVVKELSCCAVYYSIMAAYFDKIGDKDVKEKFLDMTVKVASQVDELDVFGCSDEAAKRCVSEILPILDKADGLKELLYDLGPLCKAVSEHPDKRMSWLMLKYSTEQ